MNVLVAAAELAPFVTTGGLGNAVAGLSEALARRGHEITIAVPGYRDIGVASGEAGWVEIASGATRVMALAHDAFDRRGVYGPEPGTGYEDNWLRYGIFTRAVADLSGDHDLLHLHDAHVAAAALVADVPSLLTVHNAAHQIHAPLELAAELLRAPDEASYATGPLEWWGGANYLKAGIVAATVLNTVSPTHAVELTDDETSFGLGGVIRGRQNGIVGILNGIDERSWDPALDPVLPSRFSVRRLRARAACKKELLRLAGIDDGFVLGNVGRMSRQKGFGLLDPMLDAVVEAGVRLVLAGNGELDDAVDEWVGRHPSAVAHLGYTDVLARLVSAGCDAYLMPSAFEPSGLGQLYAMRYGAPPIVHFVGGLADSVVDLDENPQESTGFGFRAFTTDALAATLERALVAYSSPTRVWRGLQTRGMSRDWSWDARAAEYDSLYERAVNGGMTG